MGRSGVAVVLWLACALAACISTGPPQATQGTAIPSPTGVPTVTATPSPGVTPSPGATPTPTQAATLPPTATPAVTSAPSASLPSATPSPIPGTGGTINLANLRAVTAGFEIVTFDSDKQPQSMGTLTLNEFDELSYGGIPTGVYRLIFHLAVPAADDPVCDFAVADGDTYQFVALPSGVALARSSQPPATAADLLVPTSSLCHVQP